MQKRSRVLLLLFSLFGNFYGGLLVQSTVLPHGASLRRLTPTENAELAAICGQSTLAQSQSSGEERQTARAASGRRHPWAVSILYQGLNRLGGTIITQYHVLTAAHGFIRFDSSAPGACDVRGYRSFTDLHRSRTVAFGDDCIRAEMPHCYTTAVQQKQIRAVFIDDGFGDGRCVGGHDWAIVEVETAFNFSDPRVRPICLPPAQVPIQEAVTVVSWGRKDMFSYADSQVREIQMRYDSGCRRKPWADRMPTAVDDYLCATAMNPDDFRSPRTCHGDSGSGMQQQVVVHPLSPIRSSRPLPAPPPLAELNVEESRATVAEAAAPRGPPLSTTVTTTTLSLSSSFPPPAPPSPSSTTTTTTTLSTTTGTTASKLPASVWVVGIPLSKALLLSGTTTPPPITRTTTESETTFFVALPKTNSSSSRKKTSTTNEEESGGGPTATTTLATTTVFVTEETTPTPSRRPPFARRPSASESSTISRILVPGSAAFLRRQQKLQNTVTTGEATTTTTMITTEMTTTTTATATIATMTTPTMPFSEAESRRGGVEDEKDPVVDNLTEPALKNATTTSIIEDNEKTGVLLRLFVPSYSSSSSLTAKKTKVKGTKESELSDGGDLLGPSALRKRRVATATTLARLKTRWLRQQRKSVEAEEQQQQQQKRRRRVKRQQATTAMATTTVAVIVGVTSFGSPGCSSRELARFTRVTNYLDRICALVGACYSVT